MTLRTDLFAGVVPFVRTAEERSFGRAAASLGITTAAVSKAVKKLEEELDVKLLDRSSRVVKLTREGEVFLERCRRAVLDVQGARDAIEGTRREPRGEISVTLPIILGSFLVTRLPRVAVQYPQLSFRLHVTDRITRLSDEGHDVAIRMGELEPSSLIARSLRKTRWVTVASPGYLARRPAPTRTSELDDHACLRFLAPNGKPRDWTFVENGRVASVRVGGQLVIDHGPLLLAAAEAGMGICQVLDFMVEAEIRAGTLVELLADAAAEGPSIYAVASQARARSTNVRAFIRFLAETFRT